jgi:sortase A
MRHHVGTFLLVIGLGVLAWAATVYLWKDPFTTAYTAYEQRKLESKLDRRFEAWQPVRRPAAHDTPKPKPKPTIDDVRREARRFRLESHEGDAIARLKIPRMHVNAVVVNGTGVADLRRGPGRHLETYMPGERELVYIAGHRTTYGAWFGKINEMQPGDLITLELPYATVVYRVTLHRIVDDNDISVLKTRHHEQLVLQACHPRFFASERYLVYATPVSVKARD